MVSSSPVFTAFLPFFQTLHVQWLAWWMDGWLQVPVLWKNQSLTQHWDWKLWRCQLSAESSFQFLTFSPSFPLTAVLLFMRNDTDDHPAVLEVSVGQALQKTTSPAPAAPHSEHKCLFVQCLTDYTTVYEVWWRTTSTEFLREKTNRSEKSSDENNCRIGNRELLLFSHTESIVLPSP